jgi:hypothetical protein
MPDGSRSCGPWPMNEKRGERSSRNVLRNDPLVARNIFVGNSAWEAGGGIRFCFFGGFLPEPTVADNLIINNWAGQHGGGLVLIAATITCTNSTIVGNGSGNGLGGGVLVEVDGSLVLQNSIVAGNTGSGISLNSIWSELETDYCDVFGNSGGDYENCSASATDISCPPEFCGAQGGDYQLFEISCCQGAGAGGYDIGARGVGCFTEPEVFFYDNFSDQEAADWNVTIEGEAALEVDWGSFRGSLVSGSVTGVPGSDFGSSFTFRLLVKPETSLPAGMAGLDIYLRRPFPEKYYRVHLSDTQGELWKRDGIQEQMLLTFPCQLVIGSWQTLSFDLIDWQMSGYLESGDGGQELFVYADYDLPILTGTVGVGLSGGGSTERVVRFDDLMVANLDSTVSSVPLDETAGWHFQPADLALSVFPNPANPAMTISFELAAAGPVRVTVHSLDGGLVRTLQDGELGSGRQLLVWRGRDEAGRPVASGTYICRVRAGAQASTTKLVVTR